MGPRISVSGGDRPSLTPCNHAVVNNHIHHFARWTRCYVAGIGADGVGMRLAHNLIHDAPHNAILFWGNEFLIENNEIYRVCLYSPDSRLQPAELVVLNPQNKVN